MALQLLWFGRWKNIPQLGQDIRNFMGYESVIYVLVSFSFLHNCIFLGVPFCFVSAILIGGSSSPCTILVTSYITWYYLACSTGVIHWTLNCTGHSSSCTRRRWLIHRRLISNPRLLHKLYYRKLYCRNFPSENICILFLYNRDIISIHIPFMKNIKRVYETNDTKSEKDYFNSSG